MSFSPRCLSLPLALKTLSEVLRDTPPQAAMVLGSGLGTVAHRIRPILSLPFIDIPDLTAPSVIGHKGCMTLGDWAGKRILVFQGRLHHYEGHPWRSVIAPVQAAVALGVRVLILTNAAGGIHEALVPGSLMIIRDHIEWNRPFCWRQPGLGGVGPERPSPYSSRLIDLCEGAARTLGMTLHQGVYAAVTGPNYETPAEIRALRSWGADAVGMSTSREAQAGFDSGLECAGLSCITNRAAGLSQGPINHQEVLTNATAVSERVADFLEQVLRLL